MTRRRPGRPAGVDSGASRGRIIDAAREVFIERGYAGTTQSAVAERAGHTRPLISHHFGGKRCLFDTVLAADLAQLSRTLEAAGRRDGFAARMRALTDAVRHDRATRSAMRFLLNATVDAHRQPDLPATGTRMFAAIEAALGQWAAADADVEDAQTLVAAAVLLVYAAAIAEAPRTSQRARSTRAEHSRA